MVFADALGVPAADRAEALAIADALGRARHAAYPSRRPRPASAGPTAAAPVLDIAAAVLAMEHGVVPPTPNVFDVCHDLDLVTGRARPAELRTALVLSRGLMGSNAALVLRRGADRHPYGPAQQRGENPHDPTALTFEELAALMKKARRRHRRPRGPRAAGPTSGFDDFGLDSLGLLGIVGELENRYGTPLPPDAERCKTPGSSSTSSTTPS